MARCVWSLPRKLLSVVLLGITAAGCAGHPASRLAPATIARSFAISSEQTTFVVRGTLNGSSRLLNDQLTVVVTGGAVFSAEALPDLRLAAVIVGQSPTGWDIVVRSPVQSLGAFREGERRRLADSLVFVAQLPPGLDVATHWLAFEFYVNGGRANEADGTTYACARVALSGVWLPRTC